MSRRKVEGIIWFVAGIILVLLLANKSKMLSDNIGENIFSLILSGITLFFGKMTWFIAIMSMLYGIILFFYEKIGINLTGCGISGTVFKLGNDFDKKFCCSWKTLVGKLY